MQNKYFLLYKHITSEDCSLGYRSIASNYIYYDISLPRALMVAHTCFNSLDLLIHINQLDIILINFKILRESTNSQLTGRICNES